ncbi:MAG: A24 family peptidase [Actinobacteria bacterium]|nr:A24 family peptidase [Actinomycetota bacterium]
MGSLLNLFIYKIPRKLPIFKPVNNCFECSATIAFYTKVPLATLGLRGGRCKSCNKKIPFISYQNAVVELLTASLFLANYIFFGFRLYGLYLTSGIILCSILIIISFIDLKFKIIPNKIILPFTLVGLSISTAIIVLENPRRWWLPLAYCAGAFIFMLIIHLIYPKGMGMGDVKLSLMLGAFLVKNVIVGLFLGFLIGSISGLILIISKKKKLSQEIPFGPFISTGSIIALFIGGYILRWYVGFI